MSYSQDSTSASGAHRVCIVTVMDCTDPDIRFDENSVSHYVGDFQAFQKALPEAASRKAQLDRQLEAIRAAGRGKPYDSILGLSGGVDSSYLAYLARQWNLRPLVVHFDNGWNSELAVNNIEEIVSRLGYHLNTYVIDWERFRDLQRAYFLASVVDIEVPTDNLIFGALFRLARKNGIRTILSGVNYATEWLMPPRWNYRKVDSVNLRAIHRRFGQVSLGDFPVLGVWSQARHTLIGGVRTFAPLDLLDYNKADAKRILSEKLGWRDYGGKHYESVFTRFYQGYVLPRKFGIDKRKAHLSNLILTGEITRNEALAELQQPPYDEALQQEDLTYVGKKLGFSRDEFQKILEAPPVPHEDYGTDARQRAAYFAMVKRLTLLRRKMLCARA